MANRYPFIEQIDLYANGKYVSEEDAERQRITAQDILRRFEELPGVILADEVGMGKTFVALAVAVSVTISDPRRRPVVVMVPPSLIEKWPQDFEKFRKSCLHDLPENLLNKIRCGKADHAEDLLKQLDDPLKRRNSIIFLTHGAMSRGLADKWIRLALIRQSLHYRRNISSIKTGLTKILGQLLLAKWLDSQKGTKFWQQMLDTDPANWSAVLKQWKINPAGDNGTDDDPVPDAILKILPMVNTDDLFEKLTLIPLRNSKYFDDRITDVKRALQRAINGDDAESKAESIWTRCISNLNLKLPLLILDEAHHLKNPETRLASLFRCPEARNDADVIQDGTFTGVFERMLFLTATPFQLGHHELCSVLERFGAINWKSPMAPACSSEEFDERMKKLRSSLDSAREFACKLDETWGALKINDFLIDGMQCPIDGNIENAVEEWWKNANGIQSHTPSVQKAVSKYGETLKEMKAAELLLKPWVIRHLKPRYLPKPKESVPRRQKYSGRAIMEKDPNISDDRGIYLNDNTLLPFLLAARVTACNPEKRPIFAEGLASSYRAFLDTRKVAGKHEDSDSPTDTDDEPQQYNEVDVLSNWYLERLHQLLTAGKGHLDADHPKISATVNKVVKAWEQREKVLVFCHYRETGRVLRQHISEKIKEKIREIASAKLDIPLDDADNELEKVGKRFFDEDSPIRRACDSLSCDLLSQYESLQNEKDDITDIIRRYLRTPSFLVRYFPLGRQGISKETLYAALDKCDESPMSLRKLLDNFLKFLNNQDEGGRKRFIEALKEIQTGTHVGADVLSSFDDEELKGESTVQLIPNVHLVNGMSKRETRQNLMLAFNTPFYPEILVASSVMAEGVDLQTNCGYVIHHDLCWNPSTLEQRTGRIDRVGALAELRGTSIQVYLPYISETQDEKMYRVVMDRERWFNVVMGETYRVDARSTDMLAERIPLPKSAARELAFDLHVWTKSPK